MIKDLILGDYSSVSSSGSGSGDPNWSSVSLLLTGNSGIVDSSSLNNTLTNLGGVTTTTTSKYGSGALAFDGGTTSMLTATSSGFALGTGDYTLECWMYKRATSADWQCLATTRNSGTGFWFGFGGGSNYPIAYVEGITSTIAVSLNTWTHLAYVRRSGTLYLYVNGVLGGSASSTQNYTNTVLNIGREQAPYNGFATNYILDDFRITKGLARYTANFTPPNTALPVGSYTAGSATPESDSNAKYVSLLLNGDGTNGAQNQTFIDSSTNNATITRYGDATQGSFGPFGNSWSNSFDGAGDYLEIPTAFSSLTSTTSNFTIEFWVNSNISLSGICPLGINSKSTGSNVLLWGGDLWINNSNVYAFSTAHSDIQKYTWVHVAICYNGTNVKFYENGNLIYTSSGALTTALSDCTLGIGAEFDGANGSAPGNYHNGLISNFRVSNNVRYAANFTVPTTYFSVDSNTILLTCQSNRFKDSSTNNAAITVFGDTKVVKGSPFPEVYDKTIHGGSAYFDGTGDYLTVPSITLPSDFTVECWFNQYVAQSYAHIFSTTLSYGTTNQLRAQVSGGYLNLYKGNTALLTNITPIISNTWYHLALVRNAGVITIYLNGKSVGTITDSTSFVSDSFVIGGDTTYQFNGLISNFRICKSSGSVLYLGNFTPSTTPLTVLSSTSLLLKFDNAGIVDASGKNDLTTVGTAQVSTAQKQFGTGSIYFNGNTSNRLELPNVGSISNLVTNWTIEFWHYRPSSLGSYIARASNTGTVPPEAYFGDVTNSLLTILYLENGVPATFNGATSSYGGSALAMDVWNHIALVCTNGVIKCYVNGTARPNTVSLSTNVFTGTKIFIGRDWYNTGAIKGYIDDLRITNNSRYSANFTSPSAPLTL